MTVVEKRPKSVLFFDITLTIVSVVGLVAALATVLLGILTWREAAHTIIYFAFAALCYGLIVPRISWVRWFALGLMLVVV